MNQIIQLTNSSVSDANLFEFKKRFAKITSTITHSYGDGFIFNMTKRHSNKWSPYELTLNHYESIKGASLYIVFNAEGFIGEEVVQEIEFAMLKNKPVVMLRMPMFDKSVDLACRQILAEKIDKITICDITMLDDNDTRLFLEQSSSRAVNYHLTNNEIKDINRRLKSYFRELIAMKPGTQIMA